MAAPSIFQTLPVELKRHILSHLMSQESASSSCKPKEVSPVNLPQLAALCKDWQPVVEELAFREITLNPLDIDAARKVLSPSRRETVHKITLKYFAPWYLLRLPPGQQAQEAERCFWIFIRRSFTLFSEPTSIMKQKVVLSIEVTPRSKAKMESTLNTKGSGSESECYNDQQIVHVEQLPQLGFVSQLKINTCALGPGGSQSRILRIASRLPQLSGLHVKVLDYSTDFHERFKLRQEMAASINTLPPNLTEFIFSIAQGVVACNNKPGSAVPSSADDALTKAFYKVSLFPQLRVFFLEAMMHETVFGPLDEKKRVGIVYPKMRSFTVRLLGDIYPGLIPPHLQELGVSSDNYPMTLAALAARQMPVLKTMNCITMFGIIGEYNRKKMTLFNKYFKGIFRMSSEDRLEWQKTCKAHHPGRNATLIIDGFQVRKSVGRLPIVLPSSF